MFLTSDPLVLVCAIIAVILTGLSKGGLGGAMAMLGVPIMAIAMPPIQAAAILLPILIVMDIFSLWSWRKDFDLKVLKIMLPGAVVGIAVGGLTAAYVSENLVRLIVGIIAVSFVIYFLSMKFANRHKEQSPKQANTLAGRFWGAIAGYTSFVSHAGGPPYQVYTLPLGQTPRIYTGTSVRFFFIVNVIKLVPYFALGQFDTTNLQSSLVLMPIAAIATLCGAWIVKRMSAKVFFPFMYALMLLTGVKLIYDGLAG
ncbi:MAG: sulfite exporter TauE/SafE family protein [Rhizobiaceae bacterium]|nr:sulfite exporter TauE/SafE family protein [Rhizobiaceae bacterium]